MGINNCGSLCWGDCCPEGGKWVVHSSRVIDKTIVYSFALAKDLLSRFDLSNIDRVVLWADTGPHFRAYSFISTLSHHVNTVLKKHMAFEFGVEHHFKGDCDGFFATLNRWKEEVALKEMICDVADLVSCYTRKHAEMLSIEPSRPDAEFIEFMPAQRSDYKLVNFKVSALPARIQSSYSWHFDVLDFRRKDFRGRGDNRNVLTGVGCHANLLSDRRVMYDRAVHPIIVDVPEEVGEDEAPEELLLAATKEYLGWKTSYRLAQPEAQKTEDMRPRLRRKFVALGDRLQDTAAQRHRPTETKQIAFMATAKRMAARRKGHQQVMATWREPLKV